jgi:hypothetical protein
VSGCRQHITRNGPDVPRAARKEDFHGSILGAALGPSAGRNGGNP